MDNTLGAAIAGLAIGIAFVILFATMAPSPESAPFIPEAYDMTGIFTPDPSGDELMGGVFLECDVPECKVLPTTSEQP